MRTVAVIRPLPERIVASAAAAAAPAADTPGGLMSLVTNRTCAGSAGGHERVIISLQMRGEGGGRAGQ